MSNVRSMDGNVVQMVVATKADIPAEKVLEGAKAANLKEALVIGIDDEGYYFASTTASIGQMLLMIERFKHELLSEE